MTAMAEGTALAAAGVPARVPALCRRLATRAGLVSGGVMGCGGLPRCAGENLVRAWPGPKRSPPPHTHTYTHGEREKKGSNRLRAADILKT